MGISRAGICARSHRAIKALTVGSLGASSSTSAAKLRSKNRYWSSASLTMNSICSANRRGLMVCSTAPIPETPKYNSMCR
ncbi:hypothetical protein D3C85_1652850 [compost metagenome]